jgi:hypothetical protein
VIKWHCIHISDHHCLNQTMRNLWPEPDCQYCNKEGLRGETNAGETMSEMLAKPIPLGLTINEIEAEPEVGKFGKPSMLWYVNRKRARLFSKHMYDCTKEGHPAIGQWLDISLMIRA